MAPGSRWFALAALAALLICFTSCQRVSANQNNQTITIAMNGDGTCTQNGSSGVIDVYKNQPVVYQGATALTEFQVGFSTCPFSSCPVSSPSGTAVNVGAPTGTAGTTYNLSSMTINNQQCKSMGAMGVRIKNGP